MGETAASSFGLSRDASRTLRTGNLKIVQRLLGHNDIATTAKYAHATVDDVRAAMEVATHTEALGEVVKPLPKKEKSAYDPLIPNQVRYQAALHSDGAVP